MKEASELTEMFYLHFWDVTTQLCSLCKNIFTVHLGYVVESDFLQFSLGQLKKIKNQK